MKTPIIAFLIFFVALSVVTIVSCNNENNIKTDSASVTISNGSMIKRGEYLVNVIGCDDCHTPKKLGPNGPEPDMDLRFSGHPSGMALASYKSSDIKSWLLFTHDLTAAVGPWGTSYSANLTSDDSGIGTWTEGQFIKALREGKLKGRDDTRPLLPPMPWPNFAKATDEDLKAMFAYFKSTKPIKNIVPSPEPPKQ